MARIGFRLGPFYFSQRLGRTQAQKNAAAKARAKRARQDEQRQMTTETTGTVDEITVPWTVVRVDPRPPFPPNIDLSHPERFWVTASQVEGLTEGQRVRLTLGERNEVLSIEEASFPPAGGQ
jgi:hypothetical protein